jgi:hypothetical protein
MSLEITQKLRLKPQDLDIKKLKEMQVQEGNSHRLCDKPMKPRSHGEKTL